MTTLRKKNGESMVLLQVLGESAGLVRMVGYDQKTGRINIWKVNECTVELAPGVDPGSIPLPVPAAPPQNDNTPDVDQDFSESTKPQTTQRNNRR